MEGRPRSSLSPTEFKLLRYFMQNPGRVLSKAQILDHVWNYDFGGEANVVESYVSYLRRKVDTTEPRLLHTLRGVGLRPAAAARVSAHQPCRALRSLPARTPLRVTLVAALLGARRARARSSPALAVTAVLRGYLVDQVDEDLRAARLASTGARLAGPGPRGDAERLDRSPRRGPSTLGVTLPNGRSPSTTAERPPTRPRRPARRSRSDRPAGAAVHGAVGTTATAAGGSVVAWRVSAAGGR